MRTSAFILAGALALLLCACPQSGQPQASANPSNAGAASTRAANNVTGGSVAQIPGGGRAVQLSTADGYSVAAWYFPPKGSGKSVDAEGSEESPSAHPKGWKGNSAPGVILLHQRGKDKSSWGNLPALLAKNGYAAIAIDLRGHGETTGPGGERRSFASLSDADYKGMLNDVAAADGFLRKQGEVDGDRIGIIGASIGADLAIMYLSQDRRVRTAVCLSPGLDFMGLKPLDYMTQVDKRPLYLLASQGDKPSADAVTALGGSGNPQGVKSQRIFAGSAHGTDLLSANQGLDKTIVSGWLLNYLPPKR